MANAIFSYLHKAEKSGNLHLRVRQPPGTYRDELKNALHRIGSPAYWNQTLWEWDYPLTVAAVVGLQRVADQYGLSIEYSPDLEQFATEQKKIEDYEKSVRLAIEKIIRDGDTVPQYITNTVNGEKPPLRHQQVAFHWGLRVSGLLLSHDPGLGKSRSGIDISRGWYDTNIIRPMQQVWLPQQNRWGVRGGILVVCPNQMQRTWRDEFALWQNMTALELTGERKKKLITAGTVGHVHIINFESLKIVEGNQYDGLIIDECFVKGTLVSTECGLVPIERVRIGDRVWAFDHINNTAVLRRVTFTFSNKPKGKLCTVVTSHGTFTCTEGHPFYKDTGYTPAANLIPGDKVLLYDVQNMREINHERSGVQRKMPQRNYSKGQTERASFLSLRRLSHSYRSVKKFASPKNMQPCLSKYSCHGSRGYYRNNLCSLSKYFCASKQIQTIDRMFRGVSSKAVRKTIRQMESKILFKTHARKQPCAYARSNEKNQRNTSAHETSTVSARWQRQRAYGGRKNAYGRTPFAPKWMGAISPYNFNIQSVIHNTEPLQVRFRAYSLKKSNRDRWGVTSIPRTAGTGPTKDTLGSWGRVVSVTIHEPAGYGEHEALCEGSVYNLEVEHDNNYFVGSTPHLVHNCHRCSNSSQQTTNVLALSQFARRKLGLTGTPVANSLESVFYQMLIIDGGRSLGSSKTAFLERWFESETIGPGIVEQVPKEGAIDEVSKAMSRCTYFLRKEEAIDLPPKIHTPIKIPMTADQERYYTSLKNEAITYIQDATVTVEQAAARMMKLRQVCQGFLLDDESTARDFNASKIEMLMDMLTNSLAGRKVVVWGVFTHEINRLCSMLHQKNIGYVRLDGTVNSKSQRDTAMKHWNSNPAVTVFVGQIQMGVGITLHANECTVPCYDCIYLGIDYSYINWVQSQDRIHRIGQKYGCNYTYLLTEGGVDAQIYKALLTKASTANQVHRTGKEFFRSLLIGDIPTLAALE